jgi:hypothetical protein
MGEILRDWEPPESGQELQPGKWVVRLPATPPQELHLEPRLLLVRLVHSLDDLDDQAIGWVIRQSQDGAKLQSAAVWGQLAALAGEKGTELQVAWASRRRLCVTGGCKRRIIGDVDRPQPYGRKMT